MIFAVSDAAGSTAVEPLLFFVTALGGATVAVIGGLVGAWIQSRREHAKWVRERRFESYVAFAAALARKGMGVNEHADEDATEALSILGPDFMIAAASGLMRASRLSDNEMTEAQSEFQVRARKALGVKR
jgi:NhaP-type Na+/H+ or K+/H+ antiporter